MATIVALCWESKKAEKYSETKNNTMILDDKLLDGVTEKAKQSERLRMNYNLHESLDAKAQRLFNALEPGTQLPIHRHRDTAETYILVRGRMNVIFYNEDGTIAGISEIDPKKGVYGAHIEKGQWHTLEVLESGTVLFEVKDGPYKPFQPEDMMIL